MRATTEKKIKPKEVRSQDILALSLSGTSTFSPPLSCNHFLISQMRLPEGDVATDVVMTPAADILEPNSSSNPSGSSKMTPASSKMVTTASSNSNLLEQGSSIQLDLSGNHSSEEEVNFSSINIVVVSLSKEIIGMMINVNIVTSIFFIVLIMMSVTIFSDILSWRRSSQRTNGRCTSTRVGRTSGSGTQTCHRFLYLSPLIVNLQFFPHYNVNSMELQYAVNIANFLICWIVTDTHFGFVWFPLDSNNDFHREGFKMPTFHHNKNLITMINRISIIMILATMIRARQVARVTSTASKILN